MSIEVLKIIEQWLPFQWNNHHEADANHHSSDVYDITEHITNLFVVYGYFYDKAADLNEISD